MYTFYGIKCQNYIYFKDIKGIFILQADLIL